jgi:hypothetical protein
MGGVSTGQHISEVANASRTLFLKIRTLKGDPVLQEPSRRRRRRSEVGCKLWMDPLVAHFDFVRLYFDSLYRPLLDGNGRLRLQIFPRATTSLKRTIITIQENIT